MRALLLVIAACGSTAPIPQPPPAPPPPTLPPPDADPVVIGRVLSSGVPVVHFGVFVVRSASAHMTGKELTLFHESGGRFRVVYPPHARQIVVAGPGFARRVLPAPKKAGTTDLGDIEVQPGFTIKGRVRGPNSASVSGAVIAIEQTPNVTDDGLLGIAHGNFQTTTDAQGEYAIHGVSLLEPGKMVSVRAWTTGLGTGVQRLSMNDQTLDFVLEPAGTLEGTSSSTSLVLHGSGATRRFLYVSVKNGSFRVDGVPADTYYVKGRQVVVTPDTVTTVQLP